MSRNAAAGMISLAALAIVTALFSLRCCCPGVAPRSAPPPLAIAPIGAKEQRLPPDIVVDGPTQAMMRNVWFHVDDTIVLRIHSLRGEMADKTKSPVLNFDDPRSFVLTLFDARIGIDGRGLSDLFNNYVLAYPEAPLREVRVVVANGVLEQEGIIHKIIDIPFRMIAVPSATPEGKIRIHPTSIEICNLDGQALMKAFGMSMEKVLDLSGAKGVTVDGNDLVIEPLVILPPPAIDAMLTEVAVDGDELLQTFAARNGRSAGPLQLPLEEPNVMYFRGGTLRMGKLFMPGGDMEVIDPDRSDPFDFYLALYNNQLTAGFTNNRPDYGLNVYMRDFSDLGQPLRPGERHAVK
jgi:hypothetical protein